MARLFWFITFQGYQIWLKSTRDWLEKLSWLDKILFHLVTSAYFSQCSRYGSGFGGYEFSLSSSTTSKVLNFKGIYLAHLLVFLSDSKDIFLFKGLSTNHFKSFKELSWGRDLMRKKDYKSSRWVLNFPCVTLNDHKLVNFYHLEPILFP